MNNHRKESRKKLIAFTPVRDLKQKILLGYVGDLTLQGMMVIGEKPVEVGGQFNLGIEFPESMLEVSPALFTISARVAYCRQDDSPQYFNIGFEFFGVSSGNAKIIEAVLERYQFRQIMDASDFKS